jgi:hypothetical protein
MPRKFVKNKRYKVYNRIGQYELTTTDNRICLFMDDTYNYEYFSDKLTFTMDNTHTKCPICKSNEECTCTLMDDIKIDRLEPVFCPLCQSDCITEHGQRSCICTKQIKERTNLDEIDQTAEQEKISRQWI